MSYGPKKSNSNRPISENIFSSIQRRRKEQTGEEKKSRRKRMKWRQLNEASGKFERDWRERKGKKKDNVEVKIDF